MDAPSSARGRGRSSGRKRSSIKARSSSQLSEPFDHPSNSESPAGPTSQPATIFTFETPSPSHARGTRMRTRHQDPPNGASADDLSRSGRSLRKRNRIDYSFDQHDDDESSAAAAAANITPAARSMKRRRTDISLHLGEDEEFDTHLLKRRASEQPNSSSRRRNPSRRTTIDLHQYIDEPHIEDDVPVQDTIEVGGHHSEENSESWSNQNSSIASSEHNQESPQQQRSFQVNIISPVREFEKPIFEEPAPKEITEVVPEAHFQEPPRQPTPKAESEHPEEAQPANGVQVEEKIPEPVQPAHLPPPAISLKEPEVNEPVGPYDHLTPYTQNHIFFPFIQSGPEASQEEGPAEEPIEEPIEEPTEDAAEEVLNGAEEDTPIASPGPADDTAANSPAAEPAEPEDVDVEPEMDEEMTAKPVTMKKQYRFKETRAASEFTDLLEDVESLSTDDLYERIAVVNRALAAWQAEYNSLRKLPDDEENAVRYNQDETRFLKMEKMNTSKDPKSLTLRKEFVVRGVRAEKPSPTLVYAKQQDRIMADAYLFEFDEKKLGQQDPLAQRDGMKTRLRDRPKQTAKAAEADDGNIVSGKRVRKPPQAFDVETISRASTPVPGRGTRRKRGERDGHGDNGFLAPPPATSTPPHADTEGETPKRRGRGGRPRKSEAISQFMESEAVADTDGGQPAKKRRRRAKEEDDQEASQVNGTASSFETARPGARRRNSRMGEIPSNSFYNQGHNPYGKAEPDDYRPPTSSSTATASTTASNYQFREKRQKHFSLEPTADDGDVAVDTTAPKPKRRRRARKPTSAVADNQVNGTGAAPVQHHPQQHMVHLTYAPAAAHQRIIEPPLSEPANGIIPRPIHKIKIKNFTPGISTGIPLSSPAPLSSNPGSLPPSTKSTPPSNGNPPPASTGDEAPKDYSQMTKSEKMSYSMKARWASGTMQGAVDKRKATLAKKKADQKSVTPAPSVITPKNEPAPQ